MSAKPRKASRLLARCLTGALGQKLAASDLPANPAEWEKVVGLANKQMATPMLRWALRAQGLFSGLPSDIAEYLDAIYSLNLDRNLRCEDQLAQLVPVLNGIGVRPVLLKGAAALVGGLYPSSGERMITDLDILIPAERLPEILDRLAGIGYEPWAHYVGDLPSPVGFGAEMHHYPPIVSCDWRASVELHVHPVARPFGRLLGSEEVFAGATAANWRGGEYLLPSPTHFVQQNIIHSFLVNTRYKYERISLRQLLEFVVASRTYGEAIDWNALRSRFDDPGDGKALRQYLALANACLDFPVPEAISLDGQDRPNIRLYLMHLDLENRSALWAINFAVQMRTRLHSLRRQPRESVAKLSTAGFYRRFFRSLKS